MAERSMAERRMNQVSLKDRKPVVSFASAGPVSPAAAPVSKLAQLPMPDMKARAERMKRCDARLVASEIRQGARFARQVPLRVGEAQSWTPTSVMAELTQVFRSPVYWSPER